MKIFLRVLLSIAVSVFVLGLLLSLVARDDEQVTRAEFFAVMGRIAWGFAAAYLVATFGQAVFRALRYRLLLRAGGEKEVPGFRPVLLVTMARNMFVDMLPARLGELTYVALLNRAYGVSGGGCVSSLSISFIFDLAALAVIVVGLLAVEALRGDAPGWLAYVAVALPVIVGIGLYCVFFLLERIVALARRLLSGITLPRWMESILSFAEDLASTIGHTRRAGVLVQTLMLSLCVRACKYSGIYWMFLAVTANSFPEMAAAGPARVMASLLSAEAASSLPIPTMMSFGSYEAGGVAMWTVLGFSASAAALCMLALHVCSQVVDYTLGGIGVLGVVLTAPRRESSAERKVTVKRLVVAAGVAGLVLVAAAFAYLQYRSIKKLGAIKPPPPGEQQAMTEAERQTLEAAVRDLKGFVVWSSNRGGNHDIYSMSLPDLAVTRVTEHPNAESYPKISPDGTRIVFSRSRVPWVSQRNKTDWDVWIRDLTTGEERLVAEHATAPAWMDNQRVVYQFEDWKVFSKDVTTGEERKLMAIDEKITLQTPSCVSPTGLVAVTLRGTVGMTALGTNGTIERIGGGCQLTWSDDGSKLFYVDKGGRQKNQVLFVDQATRESIPWLDLPEPFSHEYFPQLSGDNRVMVLGASAGGHEHDVADYEIFLWHVDSPEETVARLTCHTGNDCWPDIYLTTSASSGQ